MQSFSNESGKIIVDNLIKTIHDNKAYLSEVDGAIGDGDHGINMDKGFSKTSAAISAKKLNLSQSFSILSEQLIDGIGGSMGPLYGTFFMQMADACEGHEQIDRELFGKMLRGALEGIQEIGGAKLGDKTLLDTLIPGVDAYQKALNEGKNFVDSLKEMDSAALAGKESTRYMVAKVGRAARLGERSRGVLDAGASSCYLILHSMTDSILSLVNS